MKYSASVLGMAVLLAVTSCKEKPKTVEAAAEETKSVAAEVTEKVAEVIEKVVAPEPTKTLSDEERAAKLGFAKFLPGDTEMVASVYNTKQAVDELKALKLMGLMESGMGMDADIVPDEEILPEEDIIEDDQLLEDAEQDEEPEIAEEEMEEAPTDPWMLFGQEITVAFGKTGGEQLGRALTGMSRMSFFQAKAMGKAAQAYAKTGKQEDFQEALMAEMQGDGMIKSLLNDSKSGIALFEKSEMPPMYIAMRAKEGQLDQAAQMVAGGMSMFGMAGEMVAPVGFETGGGKFAGYKLLGTKIAEQLKAEKDSMTEKMGSENADALIAAVEKKNLIVVSGTVADYVVVMIGGNEDKMKLAADVKSSLAAADGVKFADPYADKQLVSMIYCENGMSEEVMKAASGLSTYALGLRDGISGGGGLGDTRDLEAMLQIVADREGDLLALGSSDTLGIVAYKEEGLKVEMIGGRDQGAIDWTAKTQLAHLGNNPDYLLFANMPGNAAYSEKMGDYLEAIVETAYAATVKMSELEIEAPELAEMKGYMKIFDGQFRADVVGMYDAMGGMSEGLGNESAIVVDLKGSMPAIPGMPQKFVDEAKAPRITMISPVTDRKKIRDAWKEIDVRSASLLAKIGEMSGEKIPMQKPISAEKDDMTTWFFSFPFFQDDFLPSVTVSDKWFAMSSSKTQSQDLIGKANAGGKAGNGAQFHVNFKALTEYADTMLAVVEKNSAELFTDESKLESFNRDKAEIKQVIDACREFDSLSWTARKENGSMRNSLHFKTN